MARIKHVPTITAKSDSSSPSSKASISPPSLLDPLGSSDFAKLEAQWEARARRHDRLLQRPKRDQTYVRGNGEPASFDDRFRLLPQSPLKTNKKRHPKVTAAEKNGTLTKRLEEYYQGFEQGQHKGKATWQHIPLAGFCREAASVSEVQASRPSPEKDPNSVQHLTCLHVRPKTCN